MPQLTAAAMRAIETTSQRRRVRLGQCIRVCRWVSSAVQRTQSFHVEAVNATGRVNPASRAVSVTSIKIAVSDRLLRVGVDDRAEQVVVVVNTLLRWLRHRQHFDGFAWGFCPARGIRVDAGGSGSHSGSKVTFFGGVVVVSGFHVVEADGADSVSYHHLLEPVQRATVWGPQVYPSGLAFRRLARTYRPCAAILIPERSNTVTPRCVGT